MFEVRRAEERDLPGVASVHTVGWQVAYRGIVPDEVLDGLDVGQRLKGLRTFLESNPEFELLVACENEGVLGFVGFGPARDDDVDAQTGEVYSIYVHPDRWSEGIGRALLSSSCDALASSGFADAVLWLLEDNMRTCRFYEKAGWVADGHVKQENVGRFMLNEVRYRRDFAID